LLKFLATIRLYINFPFSDEGQLHHLRIRVICNRALYRAAKRLKFYRYVTSQAFNRRYWRPPHFTSPADNPETVEGLKYHKLSDKTLADIVEASLGASFITGGLEEGLHTAIQMQIPFDDIKCWADFVPTFIESRKKVPPRAEAKALRLLNLPKICEITNRTYEKPLLLVEAMTHASLPNSQAPCYQRLEFLGDAILDFLVIRYLYSKYPNADPGQITDLKDSCVNNHVLGIICLEVGLHKHIIHYSGRLVRAIEQFEIDINKTKEDGLAVGEYWRNFNIPKVLSDVVESMLGATFVDAGFVLAPVEKLFEKWFLPILDNHVTPELIKFHPVRSFINYIQRFGCEDFKLR
jgi:endoribonuclease Dicer